jgi:hypothetical protein
VSIPASWPQVLDFSGISLGIEPSHGQLFSDAGLPPIHQFDERIGRTKAFADALNGPDLAEHRFLEMVHTLRYGILAGHGDQNEQTDSC